MIAIVTILALLGAVVAAVIVRVRRLARLTARIESDSLEPRSTFPTVAVVPARHLRTSIAASSEHADWLTAPAGAGGELGLTDRELVLADPARELLRIPMGRVVDAAFIGTFEREIANDRQVLLRVVWTRGGERLSTMLALEVPWTSAEKLRREIHLRMSMAQRTSPQT